MTNRDAYSQGDDAPITNRDPSDGAESQGKAKGGLARAAKLSAQQRSEIAAQAAQKRWALRPQKSTDTLPHALTGYKGIIDLGGMKLRCAVIEGANGVQRVLSETSIANAMLGRRSGASRRKRLAAKEGGMFLPVFLAPSQLWPFVQEQFKDGVESPLVPIDYLDGDQVVRSFDASVLPAACEVWLKAREAGALQKQQLDKAMQAEILTRALAQTGIVALIDEVTGYEKVRPQNALQAFLDKVIRKELAAWAKRFPDEFYENIYKLKGWAWPGMQKNRYSIVAHYTRDLVYDRLGPGVLKELEERSPKNDKGYRPVHLHRWLTDDIGHPMLAQHLYALLMLQRLAIANGHGWNRFLGTVDQTMPKRNVTFMLPMEMPEEPPHQVSG
jgi:hypothetical protein